MNLSFRNYRDSDRDACLAVFRSNVPRYFRDHEFDDYVSFLDNSAYSYFVVESPSAIVGCGGFAVRPGSDAVDLCWGMVLASQHGKRIGEFLMVGRLHAIANETEAIGVRLGTCQLTEGFFHRFGFETTSRRSEGIAEGLDDVQMYLMLTACKRKSIERLWREISGLSQWAPGTVSPGNRPHSRQK